MANAAPEWQARNLWRSSSENLVACPLKGLVQAISSPQKMWLFMIKQVIDMLINPFGDLCVLKLIDELVRRFRHRFDFCVTIGFQICDDQS